MKPGMKTTEGWLSALVILGQVLASVVGSLPPQYAAIGASVTAAVYALSRGLTKAGGAEAFPALAAAETTTAPHSQTAAVSTTAIKRAQLQAELDALASSP
jgi:hypothetical protein